MSEELNNAELETLTPTIAPTIDTLTTRDVGRKVVESASSSGVAKPTARDSPTAALGSQEVSNTEQETFVLVIQPTRHTPTT